jgi:hypothetical protein
MSVTNELLDLYSDYLLSSFGATTATGLSRLLEGAISHDQVTRFLSEEVKTSRDLWRVVKPAAHHVLRHGKIAKSSGVRDTVGLLR